MVATFYILRGLLDNSLSNPYVFVLLFAMGGCAVWDIFIVLWIGVVDCIFVAGRKRYSVHIYFIFVLFKCLLT